MSPPWPSKTAYNADSGVSKGHVTISASSWCIRQPHIETPTELNYSLSDLNVYFVKSAFD